MVGDLISADRSDSTTRGDDVSREQGAEFWRRSAMMTEIAARQLKKQGIDGSEAGGVMLRLARTSPMPTSVGDR